MKEIHFILILLLSSLCFGQDWKYESTIDRMTDEKSWVATLVAGEGSARLVFGCEKGKLEVFFLFPERKKVGQTIRNIKVRMGKEKPWETGCIDSGRSVYINNYDDFVKKLLKESTLAIEIDGKQYYWPDLKISALKGYKPLECLPQ